MKCKEKQKKKRIFKKGKEKLLLQVVTEKRLVRKKWDIKAKKFQAACFDFTLQAVVAATVLMLTLTRNSVTLHNSILFPFNVTIFFFLIKCADILFFFSLRFLCIFFYFLFFYLQLWPFMLLFHSTWHNHTFLSFRFVAIALIPYCGVTCVCHYSFMKTGNWLHFCKYLSEG